MYRIFLILLIVVIPSISNAQFTSGPFGDNQSTGGSDSSSPTFTGDIDASGADSFKMIVGTSPVVNANGEFAFDSDYWASGRGAQILWDGTGLTALVGIITSDTCTNGQVAKWNTGGIWTCENDSNSGGVTITATHVAYATGTDTLGGESAFNYNSSTNTLFVDILQTLSVPNPILEFKDSNTTDGDVNAYIDVNCTDTGSGTEDCDMTFKQQVAGAMTTFFTADADGSKTITDLVASSSFKVPGGTGPTVSAEGHIGIDTTGDQLKYYGGAVRVLSYTGSKSFTIDTPTASSDYKLWRVPYAVTITGIHVLATAGTNVVGGLDEGDSNGANIVAVDSDITGTAGSTVNDDGSLTNPTIASGGYINWHTTSVSGAVTSVTISYDYVVDAT